MQYFGKALGSVTKSWSAINPATLSGAVDVIVVEHGDGELSCSPFHVRFGKFQVLKPSQKKVDVFINGQETTIPMKLNEHGEAQFVFEFLGDDIPGAMFASSPVASVTSSPRQSPASNSDSMSDVKAHKLEEPDFLDINEPYMDHEGSDNGEAKLDSVSGSSSAVKQVTSTPSSPRFNPIKEKLEKINIPTKLDNCTGDLLLDIEGYKSSKDKILDSDELVQQILREELGDSVLNRIIEKDINGNIRLVNSTELSEAIHAHDPNSPITSTAIGMATNGVSSGMLGSTLNNRQTYDDFLESASLYEPGSPESLNSDSTFNSLNTSTVTQASNKATADAKTQSRKYIKTLRLTSDQLKCLHLKPGSNDLKFVIDKGSSQLEAKLYLWKWDTPIVISDIDGTITKSDAMGHVMAMIGKDWTHPGVAKLFTDIHANGYNIMYLTARSAGLADSTRTYLKTINQDGFTIPAGPVILSPDRTFTALKREVILKKPEVFKMACLNDIRKLYLKDLNLGDDDFENSELNRKDLHASIPMKLNRSSAGTLEDEMPTPFIAGFGNRITDCVSYRYVGIPRSRIFTINPYGEVHMELLELSGYKSSYLFINELVDHFFPPVLNIHNLDSSNEKELNALNDGLDQSNRANEALQAKMTLFRNKEGKFFDSNYWRDPLPDISDLSDTSDDDDGSDIQTSSSGLRENNKGLSESYRNKKTSSLSASPLQKKTNQLSFSHVNQLEQDSSRLYQQQSGIDSNSHRRTQSNDSKFFIWGNNKNEKVNLPKSSGSTHLSDGLDNDDELLSDTLNKRSFSNGDIFKNGQGESPRDFGNKVYLELNSPLSSPKSSIFDTSYSQPKETCKEKTQDIENMSLDADSASLKELAPNTYVFNDAKQYLENDEFDEDDEFEL